MVAAGTGRAEQQCHRAIVTHDDGLDVDQRLTSILTESPDSTPGKTQRLQTPDGLRPAIMIKDFLTHSECERLIGCSMCHGYTPATVGQSDGSQQIQRERRRTSRWMCDSPHASQVLYERLKPVLQHQDLENGPRGGWRRSCGLNARLRFLKYAPGDYFRQHQDERYEVPVGQPKEGDTSLMTLMLYLNEPTEGGETNFLCAGGGQGMSVKPTTGLALLFDHDHLHEGVTLVSGSKVCIRTDLMYTRRPPER